MGWKKFFSNVFYGYVSSQCTKLPVAQYKKIKFEITDISLEGGVAPENIVFQ